MSLQRSVAIVALSTIALLSSSECASAERGAPGSLLVIPEYDQRAGALTFLTVTNTNPDASVILQFAYVDRGTCVPTLVQHTLAARDTVTLLTSAHNPAGDHGYVFVYARTEAEAIKFDWLIGQSMVVNGPFVFDFQYNVEALAFRAGRELAEGQATDLDHDGLLDCDGWEYERIPNRLHFPRFLGQRPGELESDLILINLTGAQDFEARVRLLIRNDNSETFEATRSFRCWERVPLSQINAAFDNSFLANLTNDDPLEILGMSNWESGWFEVNGLDASGSSQVLADPAILAALIDVDSSLTSSISLPFAEGQQSNGSFLDDQSTLPEPPGRGVCFGDGTGGACPCSNSGAAGEGCRNSSGSGAVLSGTGTNSFANDDLRLVVTQAASNASGFFLQGGSTITLPFGDGILCVGPPTRRLQFGATNAFGNTASSISLAGFVTPGDTVFYQYWFREPNSAGPCGNASNVSSAYRVAWN